VPSYPYSGEDFEMTCGYKHDRRLTFHRIEWHRNKMLFFRYINKKGHLYRHDWINDSLISYHTKEIEIGKQQDGSNRSKDKLTVLNLRIHKAGTQISGKYECQIFMSMTKNDEELHVPANRTAKVTVVDPNDPENFTPNVKIENTIIGSQVGLNCIGEGNPAPFLVWSSVNEDLSLSPVPEESLEFYPVQFEDSVGAEISQVRLTGPFQGEYTCTADSRAGKKEVHFVETEMTDDSLSWTYKGTTTTTTEAPPPEEEPDHTYFWIMLGSGCGLAGFLFLVILWCCCCCCAKKRRKAKKRKRLIEALEAEKIRSQMLLYRGRTRSVASTPLYTRSKPRRSLSRRSTKRRAPDPITARGSLSTLSMTP